MKILITGIAGTIGSGVSKCLLQQGHEVIGLYRKNKPEIAISDKFKLIQVDLSSTVPTLPQVDLVIHGAAHTHLILDSAADDYIAGNITSQRNILEAAKKSKLKSFIQLSTLSSYGEIKTPILTEETPLNSPALYGATKYVSELMCVEASKDISVVALRLPGVVGEGYFTPWIGQVLQKAVKNEPITIYNAEKPFNNIVDFEELARLCVHIGNAASPGYNLFNVGGSEPQKLIDVISDICAAVNSKSKVELKESGKASFSISIAKLEERLKFIPETTKRLVRRFVDVNLNNLVKM